ncbi:hypothetical protein VST7929_00616 [Vibrio stylophorae]|uniref:BIG2 domain-containing protein n=1 Tax=Vibrio stylophorae TaxID=659351 RepID=A0ABM8ZRB2_9VIBR|nr:Ig-like domain-containing protein [Vibrio stylophorae]CAH0532770.1 hypothetical protein VST7929_00616 [Vibrio stylophorae]
MTIRSFFMVAISLLSSALLVGCNSGGGDGGSHALPNVSAIQINAAHSVLNKGDYLKLSVTGTTPDGQTVSIPVDAVHWSSSNDRVMTVTQLGDVNATGVGSAVVWAQYQSATASFAMQIEPAVIRAIEVSPKHITVVPGFSKAYTLDYIYSDYTRKPVTHIDSEDSADHAVAIVSHKGVEGVGAGDTSITFTALDELGNLYQDTMTVAVTDAVSLNTIELSANIIHLGNHTSKEIRTLGLFSDGSKHDISNDVLLSASDPTVLAIEQNKISGLKNGVATLTASISGIDSAPAQVHVNPIQITSTLSAFSAVKADKRVMSWGTAMYGGYSEEIADQLYDIKSLQANTFGFAALREDNTLISWGSLWDTGKYFLHGNVKEVVALPYGWSFAALTFDGMVLTWGHKLHGGDNSAVFGELTNIKQLFAGDSAFAALKNDGTVVTWGHPLYGGDSSKVKDQLTQVKSITANVFAFAALKNDGTVVTWGDSQNGGDSSEVQAQLRDVKAIYANNVSFAALKNDGTVVTWGDADRGGNSTWVQPQLRQVTEIYSNPNAYVALKKDGSVVTWGHPYFGGDSSMVSLRNLRAVYSTVTAFAAIDDQHRVITWGNPAYGGDSSQVADQLVGVEKIASTSISFAALKKNGQVVTWGDPYYGGWSGIVDEDLYDIIDVVGSYEGAYAAIREDGKLITWGQQEAGGNNMGADLMLLDDEGNFIALPETLVE